MTGTLLRPPRRTAEPEPGGFAQRPYDLVKEFVAALVVVTLLSVVLAAVFSSPDEKAVTIAQWAKAAPGDFTTTALAELDGTSGTAQYGPPYNNAGSGQAIGPIKLQQWVGVRRPLDTAKLFVLDPLADSAPTPAVTAALRRYNAASVTVQHRWTDAYAKALAKAAGNDPARVPRSPAYGPTPVLLAALLASARGGGLDGTLLAQDKFFQTDNTAALLFLADGSYLESKASAQHLAGDQWGMMNETGSYPGQAWLWLYTVWYQVKPFSTSGNADALVWGLMALLTLGFVFVPFLPGIRSVPRLIPLHRIIWRDHYRQQHRTTRHTV